MVMLVGLAQHRPDPRQQLVDVERLDQVVLRPAVEALDPVGDGAAGGQDQGGSAYVLAAQPSEQVQALDRGQAAVEHQPVVAPGQPEVQTGLAVVRDVDVVPLALEQPLEHRRQLTLVLHEEQPAGHAPIVSRESCAPRWSAQLSCV